MKPRTVIVALAIASCLVIASEARAFHGQADFARPAIEGGGEGMYFNGSPRFRRYDCSVCHLDAPGRVRLTLATDPPEVVRDGQYTPGQTYRVTVTMSGEHRGLGTMLNPNTFSMEIVDRDGATAGLYSSLGANVERPPGEEIVVARGEIANATAWSFDWQAPPPGAGPLSLHLAGVDGDGAGDRLGRTGDPYGDDVFAGELLLLESGAVATDPGTMQGGCAIAGRPRDHASSLATIAAALALLAVRGRRRRSASACALLLAAALSAGCHDPTVDTGDCVRGICETVPDSGAVARDGGGSSLEDGAPPRGDSGEPGTDAGPPPPGCTPSWRCTTWQTACDGSSDAARACTDVNACGSDWGRPPETRSLAALDPAFFRCRVQPIFDRTCAQAACHGTDDRPLRIYSRLKWRIEPAWRGTHNAGGGAALTADEWCRNFDSARGFAGGDSGSSELVTQPLAPTLGGLPHAGFTLFYETTDPDYQTIRQWLDGASLASCDAGYND